ncbi:class I SAM-dependent methyltransferase [Bacillaceae bacterium SIJ1]|uniref:class I SAM-dependent methyltransferase n=1 Tax=Litoribacterium kuwaitense TaxID=1398745 RepID=UPI0013ED6168|nr:class I SAM-dependent methyltransferase [Litoribacterium kuwaitense]NGP45229.1 class I SAM-dependent methyltransferase [Litoribacterium kuwaitense]
MVHDQVKATFGIHAEHYVTSEMHAKGQDLEWVKERLALQGTTETVLDIATGGGHTARAVSELAATVIASDVTKDMLAAARKHLSDRPNIHYVLANAQHLPFLDETFDAVTCRIAAHHFPNAQRFVEEAVRVLKPGGIFILIDNVAPENKDVAHWIDTTETLRDPSHHRCLSIAEWKEYIMRTGLTLQFERAWHKTMAFHPWVNRTLSDCQYRVKNPQKRRTKIPHFAVSGAEGRGNTPGLFSSLPCDRNHL